MIATQAAGSRQQSRFIAMLSDYGRTLELVEGAQDSTGASEQQFEKTQESLETKLNRLKDTWQEFSMGLANNQVIKGAVDALTKILEIVNRLTQGVGDFSSTFLKMGTLIAGFKGGKKFFSGGIKSFASLFGQGMGFEKGETENTPDSDSTPQKIKGFHPIKRTKNKLEKMATPNLKVLPAQKGTVDIDIDPATKKLTTLSGNFRAFKEAVKDPIYLQFDDAGSLVGLQNMMGETVAKTEDFSNIEKQFLGNALGDAAEKGAISVSEAQEKIQKEIDDSIQKAEDFKKQLESLKNNASYDAPNKKQIKDLENMIEAQNRYTEAGEGVLKNIQNSSGKVGKFAGSKFTNSFNQAVDGTKIGSFFSKIASTVGLSGGAAAGAAFTAAFVVAIAGIAAAIYAVYQQSSTAIEKRTAEMHANVSETLGDRIKNTRQEVDDLNTSLEKLQTSNDNFDSLIRGTNDWYDALYDINTQVLELANEFPELAKALKVDVNTGLMSIESKDIEEAIKNRNEQILKDSYIKNYVDAKTKLSQARVANSAEARKGLSLDFINLDELNENEGEVLKKLQNYYASTYLASHSDEANLSMIDNKNFMSHLLGGQAQVDYAYYNDKNQPRYSDAKQLGKWLRYYSKNKKADEDYERDISSAILSQVSSELSDLGYNEDIIGLTAEAVGKDRETTEKTKEQDWGLRDENGNLKSIRTRDEEMLAQAAEEAGYTYDYGTNAISKDGKVLYVADFFRDASDSKKNKLSLTAEEKDAVRVKKNTDLLSMFAEEVAASDTDAKKKAANIRTSIGEIVKGNNDNISSEALGGILAKNFVTDLSNYDNLKFDSFNIDDKTAKNLGYEDAAKLKDALQTNYDEIRKEQGKIENEGLGRFGFRSYEDQGKEISSDLIMAMDEFKNLDAAGQKQIVDQFEKLEEYGKPELLENYKDAMADIAKAGGDIGKLKFDNLIEFNAKARELSKTGKDYVGAADLFKELGDVALDEINDQLDEFIKKNDSITSDNIKDLAKQYPVLEQYIGDASDGTKDLEKKTRGLAHVLTYLSKSGKSYIEITDNILAAASATRTLADITAEMSDFVENFSPDISNYKGMDFFSGNIEKIQGYLEKGREGDRELKSYLGSMFSEEYLDENYDTNAEVRGLVNEYSQAATGGGFNILKDLYNGNKEEIGKYFTLSGNEFILNKDIDKNELTTEKIYELFAKNNNKYSKGALDSAVSTFISRDVGFSKMVEENNARAQIQAIFDKSERSDVALNKPEIDYIKSTTGLSTKRIGSLVAEISEGSDKTGAIVPEFTDEKGKKLEGRQLIDAALGFSMNEKFYDYNRLMENNGVQDLSFTASQAKNGKTYERYDLNAIEESISHLDSQTQTDILNAYESTITKGQSGNVKTFQKKYQYLENGEEKTGVATGATIQEVKDKIDRAMKEIDYSIMGEKIAEAFENVDINLDVENAKGKITELKTAIENVFGENGTKDVSLTISDNTQTIQTNLSNLETALEKLTQPKTIKIITSLPTSYNLPIPPLPEGGSADGQNNPSFKKYHTMSRMANGSGGDPVKHDDSVVLTGEEGPELIQYENGGAYLTGTQGPEMTTLDPNDVVYTAEQTLDIFKRGGLNITRAAKGIGNSFNRYQNATPSTPSTPPPTNINKENTATEGSVTLGDNNKDVNITINYGKENPNGQKEEPADSAPSAEEQQSGTGDYSYSAEDYQAFNNAYNNMQSTTPLVDNFSTGLERAMAPYDTGMTMLEYASFGDYGRALDTWNSYQSDLENQDPMMSIGEITSALKEEGSTIRQLLSEIKDGQVTKETLNKLPGAMTSLNSGLPTDKLIGTANDSFNAWSTRRKASDARLENIGKIGSLLENSNVGKIIVDSVKMAEYAKRMPDNIREFGRQGAALKEAEDRVNPEAKKALRPNYMTGELEPTEYGRSLGSEKLSQLQGGQDVKAWGQALSNTSQIGEALLTGDPLAMLGLGQDMFSAGQGMFDQMKGYAEKIAQYITQAIEVVVSAWTNRKDWLYNFLNRIEKELHEFEKLQEYANQIDEGRVVSYQELMKNWDDQFESLQKQLEMQNERIEARQQYLDWSKFIPFTLISGWSPVTDTLYENRTVKFMWDLMIGFGQMVPMFGDVFKSLDELYKDYDKRVQENYEDRLEAEKAILEIESERLKLVKAGAEEATQFEQTVMDAFIQKEQEAIDELSRLNDAITDSNQTLIDTLKNNLDEVRRIRENTDKEEDLTDKEIRLAYLRQDTSNANLNEIRKLEKDLEKENESYTDKLIDQRINDLSKQNEFAADQRKKQIDLLQGQLDWAEKYGVYWDHIYGMLYTVDEYGNIGLNQENFDERGFLRANGELSKMINTFSDTIGKSIWSTLLDNEDFKKLGVYYNAFVQYNGNEGIWRRQDMLQNPDINDNGYVSWWADKNAGPIVQFFAKIEDDWNDFWMNNDLGLWNDTVYYLRKIEDIFLKIWGWITGQSFASRAEAWKEEGGFKSEYDNNPVTSGLFALFTGQWKSWRAYNRAADGTDHASAGKWLVGEEGPELIQFKNGGAYLAGTQGPEMVNLSNGDKVYNNSDTKSIFGRGPSFGRLAEGNATLALTEPKWIEDLFERGIKQIGNLTKNTAENNRTIVNEVHLNIENMSGDRQSAEDAAQIVIDRLDEIAKYRSTNYIGHPMR